MQHPPERRRAIAALAAGSALTAAALLGLRSARAEAGFDLEQLMRTLAQVRAGEATFTETRTVAMLERTLESSGRLSFEAPDTFVRETLKPRRERVAVVGNTMTMSLGQRSRSVPLDSVPEAAVIMEAIRGTLTGNRGAIERDFCATVSGTAQRWLLELVPRETRLREQVISVRVAGQQALLREVTVALADGDRSVMRIEPVTGAPRAAPSAPSAPG
jgi:outer membrane lipoprotein-sorting protein